MKKLKFLIAYGPTRERLDPVRFLTNESTGTMGKCLIEAAKAQKQSVVSVECPKDAESALDLQKKLMAFLPQCDVLVMVAAVCDARPAKVSGQKIKKDGLRSIRLVENPDILVGLSKKKKKNQIFVGFGIESEDLLRRGFVKLMKKNLDMIVLQKVSNKTSPFGDKKIDAFILDRETKVKRLPQIDKRKLAQILVGKVMELARVQ